MIENPFRSKNGKNDDVSNSIQREGSERVGRQQTGCATDECPFVKN